MKNIGLIGCGNIAETYFRAQEYFNNINFVACADINLDAVKRTADQYNIIPLSVDEILNEKKINNLEDQIDAGVTGPNIRAAGVNVDARWTNPYSVYDQVDWEPAVEKPTSVKGADCYDRYRVRMEEMRQSVRILDQCLAKLPKGPISIDDGKIVLPDKQKVLITKNIGRSSQ